MLLIYWTRQNLNSRVKRALKRAGADYLEDNGAHAVYQTEEEPDRVKWLFREFTPGEYVLSNLDSREALTRRELDAQGRGRVFAPCGAGELKPSQRPNALRRERFAEIEALGNRPMLLYVLLGDSQEPQEMRDYRVNLSPDALPHNWENDEEGFTRTVDDWYRIVSAWPHFAWLWCQKWDSAKREYLERWVDAQLS